MAVGVEMPVEFLQAGHAAGRVAKLFQKLAQLLAQDGFVFQQDDLRHGTRLLGNRWRGGVICVAARDCDSMKRKYYPTVWAGLMLLALTLAAALAGAGQARAEPLHLIALGRLADAAGHLERLDDPAGTLTVDEAADASGAGG
ncbi:hypothetical protein G6F50_014991 [Rhizopus delemar]|uniref:Uncharacterized protein n=1 Tax=Rhizopus delemar TaxID=936053 RepID=A0A9P6Y0Y3_9FUNG|nr:hypothetical protein G6F50_014991 [Rhizopus delemar]